MRPKPDFRPAWTGWPAGALLCLAAILLSACGSATQGPSPATSTLGTTSGGQVDGSPRPDVTLVFATATGTPTGRLVATVQGEQRTDKAEFVGDITVPDGSDFTPGARFTKTWRVMNAGTSIWTPQYALVFARGARMGAPDVITLTTNVAPGQTIDLSLEMTAPESLGRHIGFWQLRNAAGSLFGVGPAGNEPVYLLIDVVAGGLAVPTAAVGTPVTGGGPPVQVTAITVSVEEPLRAAPCPQTFIVNGTIASEGAGTVTYQLEAIAETPGFQINLPAATSATFSGAGPRAFAVRYELEFRDSVSGQLWLHILGPNDLRSDPVSFSLTCQP